MGKICKITFSKIKLHKNKLVSARNVKGKKPQKLNKKNRDRKMNITVTSDQKTNPFLPVARRQFKGA